MAKNRYINTKFWSDPYIVELDPLERYLFLYLITNEHTDICGMYELALRVMAFETGIDKEMLPKMLKRFEDTRKIVYRDGWVFVVNFAKHQETGSPTIASGIKKGMEKVPTDVMQKFSKFERGTDAVSINPELFEAEEIKKPEAEPVYKQIFDVWNMFAQNQKDKGMDSEVSLTVHKKCSEEMQSKTKAALRNCDADELARCIHLYAKVLGGKEYYWTHRWNYLEFMQRGYKKFMDKTEKDFLNSKMGSQNEIADIS